MAKKEKETKKKLSFFKLPEKWEVENVRVTKFGTFFTLRMPGLSLYDLKVVYADGYDPFIGVPQKSYEKDGKTSWINVYSLYLSNEDTEAVIEAVEEKADEEEEDD